MSDVPPPAQLLFPLPLTPFEQFLLLDERPGYPMTFFVEMAFEGRADASALNEAIVAAVRRSPLLDSRVSLAKGRPLWVGPEGGNRQILQFGEIGDGCLDLKRETGFRAAVREEGGETRLTLLFHHVCCDGQGARRVIVDLLTGYARSIGAGLPLPPWDSVDPLLLLRRGAFRPRARIDAAPPLAWEATRNMVSFLTPAAKIVRRRSAPLAAFPSTRPLIVTEDLDASETLALEDRARRAGTSVNDVAVAELFRTIVDWNRDLGRTSGRQRFRILVPTDLRELADRHLPAANRLGFSFPLRRARECTDGEALLAGISKEMSYIKASRLGLDFVSGIEALLGVPGALPLLLHVPTCMATAVLTNLDDPGRRFRRRFPSRDGSPLIGNLVLRKIYGAPPIRPGTRAGFGIALFGDLLTVTARCDPAAFDEAAARELTARFADSLRKS